MSSYATTPRPSAHISAPDAQVTGVVTIVIPIYRRLQYLPGLLRAVAAQDYPNIELIVSDNGQNAAAAKDILAAYYPRPWRFRQTGRTVSIPDHYHQTLAEARGEYFVWLADDDLIDGAFVSSLVRILQNRPDVSVAMARQDVIDTNGRLVRHATTHLPDMLSGEEFVRSWTAHGFENYSTYLARTRDVRECGGYGQFPTGTASDDILLLKLCLRGAVGFSRECAFQYRWHETSAGLSITPEALAADMRRFLRALETDPLIRAYARQKPAEWAGMKRVLVEMTWRTYLHRWRTLYRPRLSRGAWIKAAFRLPFIFEYYRAVGRELLGRVTPANRRRNRASFAR